MVACGFKPRWLPHNVMLADPLTKTVAKSNMAPLLGVMKGGTYKIVAEGSGLEFRQELKAQGGLRRLKGSAASSGQASSA